MSIRSIIVPFTARKTTGTQDITSTDVTQTPVAAYFVLFQGAPRTLHYAGISKSVGAADSTRQWTSHAWFKNTSSYGRTFRNNQVLRWFDVQENAQRGTASAVGGGAGPLTNGWRLNWTFSGSVGDDQYGYVIFFFGSSAQAYVGVHTTANAINIGFTPKFILSNTSDVLVNTTGSEAKTSFGVHSIFSTSVLGNVSGYGTCADSSTNRGKTLRLNEIPAGGLSTDFTYYYNHFATANNLTIVSPSRSDKAVGFLALNWTGTQRSFIRDRDAYAYTNDTITEVAGVGWRPQILGYFGNGLSDFGNISAPSDGASYLLHDSISGGTLETTFSESTIVATQLISNRTIDYWVSPLTYRIGHPDFTATGWEFPVSRQTYVSSGFPNKWVMWGIESAGLPVVNHTTSSLIQSPPYTVPRGTVANNGSSVSIGSGNATYATTTFSTIKTNLANNNKLFVIVNVTIGDTSVSTLQGNRLTDSIGNVFPRSTNVLAAFSFVRTYFYIGEVNFGNSNQIDFQTLDINSSGSSFHSGWGFSCFDPDEVAGNGYFYDSMDVSINTTNDIWTEVCRLEIPSGMGEKWALIGNPCVEWLSGTINPTTVAGFDFQARIRVNGETVSPIIREVFNSSQEIIGSLVESFNQTLNPGSNTITLEIRTNNGTGKLLGSLVALRHTAFEAVYNSGTSPITVTETIPGSRNITHILCGNPSNGNLRSRLGTPSTDSGPIGGALTRTPPTQADSNRFAIAQRTLINVASGASCRYFSDGSNGSVESLALKFLPDSSITDTSSHSTSSFLVGPPPPYGVVYTQRSYEPSPTEEWVPTSWSFPIPSQFRDINKKYVLMVFGGFSPDIGYLPEHIAARIRDNKYVIPRRSVFSKNEGNYTSSFNYYFIGEYAPVVGSNIILFETVNQNFMMPVGTSYDTRLTAVLFDPTSIPSNSFHFVEENAGLFSTNGSVKSVCTITIPEGGGVNWTIFANPSVYYYSGNVSTPAINANVDFEATIKINGSVIESIRSSGTILNAVYEGLDQQLIKIGPQLLTSGPNTITLEIRVNQGSGLCFGSIAAFMDNVFETFHQTATAPVTNASYSETLNDTRNLFSTLTSRSDNSPSVELAINSNSHSGPFIGEAGNADSTTINNDSYAINNVSGTIQHGIVSFTTTPTGGGGDITALKFRPLEFQTHTTSSLLSKTHAAPLGWGVHEGSGISQNIFLFDSDWNLVTNFTPGYSSLRLAKKYSVIFSCTTSGGSDVQGMRLVDNNGNVLSRSTIYFQQKTTFFGNSYSSYNYVGEHTFATPANLIYLETNISNPSGGNVSIDKTSIIIFDPATVDDGGYYFDEESAGITTTLDIWQTVCEITVTGGDTWAIISNPRASYLSGSLVIPNAAELQARIKVNGVIVSDTSREYFRNSTEILNALLSTIKARLDPGPNVITLEVRTAKGTGIVYGSLMLLKYSAFESMTSDKTSTPSSLTDVTTATRNIVHLLYDNEKNTRKQARINGNSPAGHNQTIPGDIKDFSGVVYAGVQTVRLSVPAGTQTYSTVYIVTGSEPLTAESLILKFQDVAGGPITSTLTHTTNTLLVNRITTTHTTNSLLRGSGTLQHTTNALLRGSYTRTNITNSLLRGTYTVIHTTNSLLRGSGTLSHTTNSLFVGNYLRVHSINSSLQSLNNQVSHTASSLLQGSGLSQHTSNSSIQLQNTLISSTTNSLLVGNYTRTHTTDAFLKIFDATVVHTTDSLLRGSGTLQHTTDSALKALNTLVSSTTNSLLQSINIAVVSNTDSALKALNTLVSSTTNTLLQGSGSSQHATNSSLKALNTLVFNTTNTLLQSQNITVSNTTNSSLQLTNTVVSSTTNSLLQSQNITVSSFTNSSLQALNTLVFSTTNALLQGSGSLQNTTNSVLQKQNVLISNTTVSLLVGTFTSTHTSNSLLQGSGLSQHTTNSSLKALNTLALSATDSLLQSRNVVVSSTTNSLLQLTNTIASNTTSSLLQYQNVVVSNTTNSFLKYFNLLVSSATNSLLQSSGSSQHTTNSLLQYQNVAVPNTINSLLVGTFTNIHTTDSLFEGSGVLQHATNSSLKALNTSVSSTTNSLLQLQNVSRVFTTDTSLKALNVSVTSTTDTLIRGAGILQHSTNSLLQSLNVSRIHTSNSLLQTQNITNTHTANSWLFKNQALSNNTDSLLQYQNVINIHTTNSWLFGIYDEIHSTDSALKALNTVVFATTDSLLGGAGVLQHTTNSSLKAIGLISVHTTNSSLQQQNITSGHISNSFLKKFDVPLTHTVNSSLQQQNITRIHTTDSFLKAFDVVIVSTTNSLLGGAGVIQHTSNSMLQLQNVNLVNTTSSLLKDFDVTVFSTTGSLLGGSGIIQHTTSSSLQSRGVLVVHSSNSMLSLTSDEIHTTSSFLKAFGVEKTHSSSSLFSGSGVLQNTTSSLLQLQNVSTVHSSSSLLSGTFNNVHSTNSLLSGSGILSHSTDSLVQLPNILNTHTSDSLLLRTTLEMVTSHTTNALIKGSPEGFGDQDNPTFSTTSAVYTTAYTINADKFKPNTQYLLMLQWQMSEPTSSGVTFASRVMHNGSVVSNGEFLGHSQTPNVKPNCLVLTRITQPSVSVPITIEIKTGDSFVPIAIESVRWFVIDQSTLNGFDYSFNEVTSLIPVSNSTGVVSVSIPSTNEDWIIFYCNKLISDIPFSGTTCNVTTDFRVNNTTIISSPKQGFNGPGFMNVNRVTTMMLPHTINSTLGTSASIVATKNQLSGLPNAVRASGSILALRAAAFQATSQKANNSLLSPINKLVPPGTWLALHCGWNLNLSDPSVVSNGLSLSSSAEGSYGAGTPPTVESFPVGYDFRSDNLSSGIYSFVYNDSDIFGDGIQSVLLLKDPIPTYDVIHTTDSLLIDNKSRHTTNASLKALGITVVHTTNASLVYRIENTHTSNSLVALFRVLGHGTDTLLSGSFNVGHSSDSFLADFTIRGTASFLVGLNLDAVGISTDTIDTNYPSCTNKRILGKYGWESTSTPTKTFSKCDIKR